MKNFTPLLGVMLLCHSITYSQNEEFKHFNKHLEIVNAAGGDALGSGGSVAYSLGTIFYTTLEASDVSVSQGAQQAEEQTVEEVVPAPKAGEQPDEPESEAEAPISNQDEASQQEEVPAPEDVDPIAEEQSDEPEPKTQEPISNQDQAPKQEESTTDGEVDSIDGPQPSSTQGDSEFSEQEVSPEEGNIIDQNLVDEGLADEIQRSNEVKIITFPNPAADSLTIYIENFDRKYATYYLLDFHGRLLESNSITSHTTKVMMNHRSASTYLLRVVISKKVAKTFKIIKN